MTAEIWSCWTSSELHQPQYCHSNRGRGTASRIQCKPQLFKTTVPAGVSSWKRSEEWSWKLSFNGNLKISIFSWVRTITPWVVSPSWVRTTLLAGDSRHRFLQWMTTDQKCGFGFWGLMVWQVGYLSQSIKKKSVPKPCHSYFNVQCYHVDCVRQKMALSRNRHRLVLRIRQ